MNPIKIGAALNVSDLPTYRDWLIAEQRDLEMQDFHHTNVLLGDWQSLAQAAKKALDGFEGRLGIHGPFMFMPMDCTDPELMPIITKRYLTGLDAAIMLGATQMVVHSPFSIWDYRNFGDRPRLGNEPSHKEKIIAACHNVMMPVVRRAEDAGITLVIENCDDISPLDRLDLAQSFNSDRVKVSLDTGHAHNVFGKDGSVPVDYFVTAAGESLAHVHLQDTDGYADRHWAPGQGTIKWHSVFRALAALPVTPHLVLELRNRADIWAGFSYLHEAGLVY